MKSGNEHNHEEIEEDKLKDTRQKIWADKGQDGRRDRATDLRTEQGRKIRRMRTHFTTNFCEMPRKSLSTRSLIFSQNLKKNKLCISTK